MEALAAMNTEDLRKFAGRLIDRVWIPFDDTCLSEFYWPDVVGHHRNQTIHLADIANRLRRDRGHWKDPEYDVKDLVAEKDKFSLRFIFSATQIATGKRDEVEVVYFYHLRDGKISKFWTLSSVDYDYFGIPKV
jgi:predicted ester cyclase